MATDNKCCRPAGPSFKRIFLTGCAFALYAPAAAYAADITVSSGTTVTTTQTLTDLGDAATVESGGMIDVTDEDGLVLDNDDQTAVNNGTIRLDKTVAGLPNRAGIGVNGNNATVTNNGTITTEGDRALGIASGGDGLTVHNSGSVSTSGDDAVAILSLGDNSLISNSGTLSTRGDDASAINSDGDGTSITNSGTITTTGDNGDGIDSDGVDVTVSNSGVITLSGTMADGIDNDGDNATILNSGVITVSGEDSNGIESTGADVTITNSGTITNTGSVSGSDDEVGHGISVVGDDAVIVNSGKIFSSYGSSLYIDGSNATVTLQEGTILQGILTFTDPATATFNYAADRTAILTFSGFPGTLSTGGLASSTSGSTVTILNPDDFRAGSINVIFNALTRAYAGSLEDRMEKGRLGTTEAVATRGKPAAELSARNSLWAAPIGGVLDRQGDDGYNHAYGGLMAGADRIVAPDLRAGVTGGFSLGRTESNDDIHSAQSYSLFAGAYAGKDWQATFAKVSLLGGYLKTDEDVTILNNMVSGGLQDLSIGYAYLYVSPSARLGHAVALSSGTLTPSARIRYSGLWQMGDSNEPTTSFAVSGRSLHILEVRTDASYDFAPLVHENGTLFLGMNAGIDGIITLGDTVDASFAGAALDLSTGTDAVLRGFASADAVWEAENGLKLRAGVEGGYDSEETLSAAVRLGVMMSF